MARLVSLVILTIFIVFLGVMFFQVIAPFLLPLFLAGVVAIICQPLFRHFDARLTGRTRLAAGLTTLTVLSTLLVPLFVGTFIASVQIYSYSQDVLASDTLPNLVHPPGGQSPLDRVVDTLNEYLPADGQIDRDRFSAVIKQNVQSAVNTLSQRSLGIAGRTLGVLGAMVAWFISLLVFVIALYYFLADGPNMLAVTERLVPVQVDYQRQMLREFTGAVRAVVTATFAASIGQGLATATVMFAFGFHHFFIVFLAGTSAALIPLAGVWLVWGPYAVWLFLNGHWVMGLFLTLIGIAGLGLLDNVIRTYVLHSDAKLHPLLAFVSVLGGLASMGIWGVFIGPIVACCLYAMVKIFNSELSEWSREKFKDAARPGQTSATRTGLNLDIRQRPEAQDVEPEPVESTTTAPKRRRRRRRRRPAKKT